MKIEKRNYQQKQANFFIFFVYNKSLQPFRFITKEEKL